MEKNVELATFHYPVLLLRYMYVLVTMVYAAVFLNLNLRSPELFVARNREKSGEV